MANAGSSSGDVFEVRKVRRLVELMNEHDLAEIDLRQGDQRIRLRRGAEPTVNLAAPIAAPQTVLAPTTASTAAPASEPPSGAKEEEDGTFIRSPMVGTFYTAASPDNPPFVKVGDQVGRDTTVCIVEAMKVFNEIPADCNGKIASVLVENGDAVEFGQPLFRVE